MYQRLFIFLLLGSSSRFPLVAAQPVERYESENESELLHRLKPSPYFANIISTQSGLQHVLEVQFNGVSRYLTIDTGSADTWMIAENYQCVDVSGNPVPQSTCAFGEPYTGPLIMQNKNQTFVQQYASGESLSGILGYANVTVAGLSIPRTKVALVDRGTLFGDNVRSGVIGLAPRQVSREYQNTDANTSPPNGTISTYRTVFESMYTSGQIPELFSLALQRGENGGYIAFGGLPPVNFTHDFTTTRFTGISYYGRPYPKRFYPIQLQSYQLNGRSDRTSDRVIIDSGTPANRLPTTIADRINAAFNPPAVYNDTLQLYVVPCNATPPAMGFGIGGKMFHIHPSDMFLGGQDYESCLSSVMRGYVRPNKAYPDGLYALGDAFLNNVVATFDVEYGEMHFAPHIY